METIKTLLIDPFLELLGQVAGFIPTLVSVLFILVLGILLARVLRDVVTRFLKEIRFDGIADKLGVSDALKKGEVKPGFSDLIGSLLYLIVMVIFVIMTIKLIGLTMMTDHVSAILGYIPKVFSGVIILVLGMVLAKIAASIVHIVAHLTGSPNPKLMERITKWAVLLYVVIMAIGELGYGHLLVGRYFDMLFGGIVFAYALAFGLGGKDKAAKYLDKK